MDYPKTKVYFDGSHYIGIPHTTRPWKRKKTKDKVKTEQQEKVKEIYKESTGTKKEKIENTINKVNEEIKDIECYSDVKMYVETLRRLVADVSAKSFEKLGYLGILIHLDTIINFNDFRIPDKMFALLNDETTKIPESLNKAKNQIEDRYLKIRKSSISKK